MAKKNESLVKRGTEALSSWDEELAKDAQEQASKESIGSARLSVRGGRFSVGGNALKDTEIPVVVLDHVFENSYYEGKFNPDAPQTPVCYAFGRDQDELKPHPKAPSPQCETCAACPHNQFGSADTGRGKACKNSKRLVIVSGSEVSPESIKDGEALTFNVPVTSVKAWAHYLKGLASTYRRPAYGVVTQLFVEPDEQTQFKVGFRFLELLSEKFASAISARRADVQEALTAPYPAPREEPAPKARPSNTRKPTREKF